MEPKHPNTHDGLSSETSQIHPNDEMYKSARARLGCDALARVQYLRQGKRIADTVSHVTRWCFEDDVPIRLIDFAAGYGRAARYLAYEFGADNVHVADLQEEAVSFCATALKLSAVVSSPRPTEFASALRYDVVLAVSFFSHLPDDLFRAWLHQLAGLMSPCGILLFSTHGFDLANGHPVPSGGHLFVSQSENARLDPSVYGTSYVTEDYVCQALRQALGDTVHIRYLPKGMCSAQDLYVASRVGRRRVAYIPDRVEPTGLVRSLTLYRDGRLEGELVLLGEDLPASLHVEIDGIDIEQQELCRHLDRARRNPYGPWTMPISLKMTKLPQASAVLQIKARSQLGVDGLLALRTVASLLEDDT
jgi:2-polyprenyl-3-methyl-5-hydroxy-6-metoxy-1,4-benzoquinol methylase